MTNTPEWRKMCYEEVFLTHRWGNPKNAGKGYVRPYNKTKKNKEEAV